MADLKISALTASTTPLAGTEVLPIVQSSTTKQVSVANLTAGRAVSTGILTATHPTQGGFDETLKLVSVANSGDDGPVMTFFGNSTTKYYGFIGGYDIAANKGGVKIGVGNGETSISSSMTAVTITNEKNIIAEAGNFVVGTSGKGIDFSATPGTGTSELFSDYEEGKWTPSISSGATASAFEGWYTKIGRMVYCYGLFNSSEITGNISLGGLPFTSASYSTGYIVSSVTCQITAAVAGVNAGVVIDNSTTFTIPITAGYTGATYSQFFALWYQAA